MAVIEGVLLERMKIPLADSVFICSLKKLIVQCYGISAKYKDAKNCKGIRAAVYKYAQMHRAYYSPTDRSKSIWYDEGTDLNIELWFKEETKALGFGYSLALWHQENPFLVHGDDVTVEEGIKSMSVETDELSPVLLTHYVAGDSESPIQSLAEFDASKSSTCSVVSSGTPLAQFQSLEDPDKFQDLNPYVCHIKPKARFEQLKDKEYNKIAASWPFHQMFDGMCTVDLNTGEQNLPLVAVMPLKTETKEEMIGEPATKRTRIGVELEFRNPHSANEILLKPGSTKISDTKWKTFVHVEDVDKFCECLEWKNKDTRKKWKQADQVDSDRD